jgi:hypothetical protein
MYITEMLYPLIDMSTHKLSKQEVFILEAELFTRLCEELKEFFKNSYKAYFRLLNFSAEMEDMMIEERLIRFVINDILSTEEYTLPGIAYYIKTPEEVVYDIAIGRNTDPSSTLFRKIIKLHRSVRPNLYRKLLQKIFSESLTQIFEI